MTMSSAYINHSSFLDCKVTASRQLCKYMYDGKSLINTCTGIFLHVHS